MKIGIDLGTTFSAGAYVKPNGEPELIINQEGSRLTPSVVMIEPDGQVVVGEAAKENCILNPNAVISAVKNQMGKRMTFSMPDGSMYTPEMISGFILKKIVSDAESYVRKRIDGVVVTIPAYYTDAQRKATADAAKIAGLNLLAMINEPTAAAIYYARKSEKKENVLVYDLGGGTFDATVLRTQNGSVEVLATHGLPCTGGSFLDQTLIDYVCEHFLKHHAINLKDEEYLDEYQELALKAESCKIQLSGRNSASIVMKVGKIKENIPVTRAFFEEVANTLYMRTEADVKKVLRDAKLTVKELSKIILVGGSTKIPFIERRIKELTGITPSKELSPDEAVALGAALFAQSIGAEAAEATVKDVCSHSIGLAVFENKGKLQQVNHILIRRNTRLPVTAPEQTFYTTISGQKAIELSVTEGEFRELSDVTVFSSNEIPLPAGLPERTEVKISLALDRDQLLHVYVSIPAVKLKQEYNISRNSNMNDKELEAAAHKAAAGTGERTGESHRSDKKTHTQYDEDGAIPYVIQARFKDTVGLEGVQKKLAGFHTTLQYHRERELNHLETKDGFAYHFIVSGNAGSGKSTVASIIAELLSDLGVCHKPDAQIYTKPELTGLLSSTDRLSFQNTVTSRAAQIVWLDNLHELYESNDKQEVNELVRTLVSGIEALCSRYCFILTGSPDALRQMLSKHPALQGIFIFDITMPAYTAEEYVAISRCLARRDGYRLTQGACNTLRNMAEDRMKSPLFAGIKAMETLLKKAVPRAAARVARLPAYDEGQLKTIEAEDLQPDIKKEQSPEHLLRELDALTGLGTVKEKVRQMVYLARVTKERMDRGHTDKASFGTLHLVLKGNAGTGKTTVARIIAGIYGTLGLLPDSSVFVECGRADLVAQYVGQTAPKVKAMIDKAMGGVLFIDEAYALCADDRDIFGREAIDTLVADMENRRDGLMVILAGYSDEMDAFLARNQGLSSRVPTRLVFEDYTTDEMTDIFVSMLQKNAFTLGDGGRDAARRLLEKKSAVRDFGNARGVRNLAEKVIAEQSVRLGKQMSDGHSLKDDELKTILKEDILGLLDPDSNTDKTLSYWTERLNELTGLSGVKLQVQKLVDSMLVKKKREELKLEGERDFGTLHMVFKGNAGTGKTMVARIIAGIYSSAGILPDGSIFVECGRADLVGAYQGQTALKVKETVHRAVGGVLFIDEAYALCSGDRDTFGREAVDALIAYMENYRDRLMVIFAGYCAEMEHFFSQNQGLASRVPTEIVFEDYSAEEMLSIFKHILRGKNLLLTAQAEERAGLVLAKKSEAKDFGNARGVRNLVQRTVENQNSRIGAILRSGAEPLEDDYKRILPEDIE